MEYPTSQQNDSSPAELFSNSAMKLDAATGLSAERTLLSWVRTGLSMMGFGFVVARFGLMLRELARIEQEKIQSGPSLSHWVGSSLILMGAGVLVISGIHHILLIRHLSSGRPYQVKAFSFAVFLSFALAILGLTTTILLFLHP